MRQDLCCPPPVLLRYLETTLILSRHTDDLLARALSTSINPLLESSKSFEAISHDAAPFPSELSGIYGRS
jgi:hypothetical protein